MIAKDGYSIVLGAIVVFVLLAILGKSFLPSPWGSIVAWIAALLLIGIVLFFRDPERKLPADTVAAEVLVAPADGRVIEVVTEPDNPLLPGDSRRISIFLSIFNVHVTRIPADGIIQSVSYRPGRFKAAWDETASRQNERSEFVLHHPSGAAVVFKQIAGLVARRVMYHLSEGDSVSAGARFGLIRFGSRMDISVPMSVSVTAKVGDRVVAGQTVLGHFIDHNEVAVSSDHEEEAVPE